MHPDNSVRIWGISDQFQAIYTLRGHDNQITSLAFNADGTLLASGSADHTVRLWDPLSGSLVNTLRNHRDVVQSVEFNPSGTKLVSSTYGSNG